MKSLLAVILGAGLFAAATESALADCGANHDTTADNGKSVVASGTSQDQAPVSHEKKADQPG